MLNKTHFSSEDITFGYCSFKSDRAFIHIVILGDKKGGCCRDGNKIQMVVNEDTENITCPMCGEEKDEFDEYCYDCIRKIEEQKEEYERNTIKNSERE